MTWLCSIADGDRGGTVAIENGTIITIRTRTDGQQHDAAGMCRMPIQARLISETNIGRENGFAVRASLVWWRVTYSSVSAWV